MAKSTFKVWVQVEKMNQFTGEGENVTEPQQLAEFKNQEDAEAFVLGLENAADLMQNAQGLKFVK